jgi:cytochrome c-type biogenesis protein CcmH
VFGQNPAADSVQAPYAGSGDVGRLGDPTVVGRNMMPTTAADNNEAIKAIELKLACRCGCTLDVFTCRTTDFSCTYSPAMHREVVALYQKGNSAQQILDAFVGQYGEKVLMAPPAEGFNLAGYLVPGAVIAVFGGFLVWLIGRRQQVAMAAAGPATGLDAGAGAGPSANAPAHQRSDIGADPSALAASDDELARLQRALDEVED